MKIKIDHINLSTRDLSESISWYRDLFGFEFKEGNLSDGWEPWAIIGKDDFMVCLYEDKKLTPATETGEGPHHRIYHFGIRVSDRAEWERIVAEKSVNILYGGVYKYPNSLSWYIIDPSGHEIEVSWCEGESLSFPPRAS